MKLLIVLIYDNDEIYRYDLGQRNSTKIQQNLKKEEQKEKEKSQMYLHHCFLAPRG